MLQYYQIFRMTDNSDTGQTYRSNKRTIRIDNRTDNDNLASVLLAGPAVLQVLPLAKLNFDILVLQKDPYIEIQ